MDELSLALKNIGQDRDTIQTAILEGNALKSHDEYRYQTGRLHGLMIAENHIRQIQKRMAEAADSGEAH